MLDQTFKSLLSLDDMVLRKIVKCLNIIDLVNLGETCKRLNYLTQYHFKKSYTSVRWRRNSTAITLNESGKIFRKIGKYLQKINLAFWSDLEFYKILVTLGSECSHLESITLDSVRMNCCVKIGDPVVSLMFSKLKQFVLKRCYWSGWCPLETFFGKNSTLEQLCVIDCVGNQKLHLKEFRALKELQLTECRNLLTSVELQRCFENNDISTLSLTNVGNVDILEQHLINSMCNSIESLTLDYHGDVNFNLLLRLTKLTRLRLQSNKLYNVDELISKLNTGIEKLELTNIFVTATLMQSLNSFKKLKHLSFERCSISISDEFLSILPTILPNLQHLVYT